MPLTKREDAKDSGFAQVRAALLSFEGDVVSAEFDKWGGALVDEDGKQLPIREFLEVASVNVKVLEVSEELSMPIDEWTFRVNCSDYKGSFWVEDFLASADLAKLLIPDDLKGKRIVWKKVKRSYNIKDRIVETSNFVIAEVKGAATATSPIQPAAPARVSPEAGETAAEYAAPNVDPMAVALDLAVGKTETQFRSAVSLHPSFMNSPLLPLAKAGAITQTFLAEGKLVEVQEDGKTVYRKP